jgi:peptidoglycan/LPS O-acetylase OafA/YrhL
VETPVPVRVARRLEWVPALDGLRAIAVLMVLLVHFQTNEFFPGGSSASTSSSC